VFDDLKEIVRPGVAFGAEHAHQTFHRDMGGLRQPPKAHRGVDVISLNGLAGGHVPGKEGFKAGHQPSSLCEPRRTRSRKSSPDFR